MIPLLFFNWATAATFATLDAYVAHITNGVPIDDRSVQTSAGDRIIGAIQWSLPSDPPGTAPLYFGTVYVLEKLKGGGFREVVRSKSFDRFSPSAVETFDGIEIQSNSRFSVRLHSFTPLGTITYRFALIDRSWRLSGRDEEFLYFEKGDEALGDTREEHSTNFLTGKIIEKRFRRNNFVSAKTSKAKFPRFPLVEFVIFDERHGPI